MKWSVKKRGRFWLVQGGREKFWLTPYFFKKLSPYFEQEVEAEKIKELILSLLKERVIYFLSLRDRSEFEIKNYVFRLRQEKFLPQIIKWLKHLNLLSDYSFGLKFVDYQKQRLFGPFYIARQLKNRGLNEKLIEEVLLKSYTKEEERKKARALFKKYSPKKRLKSLKEKAKMVRFFSSRGFSREIIYELMEDL